MRLLILLLLPACISLNRHLDCGTTGGCPVGMICGPNNSCITTTSDLSMTTLDLSAEVVDSADFAVIPTKVLGDTCTGRDECLSGHCADGLCCDQECADACYACNLTPKGSCQLVAKGEMPHHSSCPSDPVATCNKNGACDGTGHCGEVYGYGTQCSPEMCSGSTYTYGGQCDGAGTCVHPTTSCGPITCDDAGQTCRTTCSDNMQCTGSNMCLGNSCGKKAAGVPCSSSVECDDTQSLSCIDGVCCNSACTASCSSCRVQGNYGVCTAYPFTTPSQPSSPRSCPAGTLCNGGADCVSHCVDGIHDGDETDVDCGGSCSVKCARNKYCVSAGDCSTGRCLNNFCSVAPVPGWKVISGLSIKAGGRAAFANDTATGKIYVFDTDTANGDVAAGFLDTTTLAYQPLTGLANFPADGRRTDMTAVFLNGGIYGFGGRGGDHDAELYSVNSDSWRSLTAIPPRNPPVVPDGGTYAGGLLRDGSQSLADSGFIYVMGGEDVAFTSDPTIDRFDTDGNSWSTSTPSFHIPRSSFAAAALNGTFYVFGGYPVYLGISPGPGQLPLNSGESATPGQSWTLTPYPILTKRFAHDAIVGKDGRIYLVGGQIGDPWSNGMDMGAATSNYFTVGTVETYDPKAGVDTALPSLNHPRQRFGIGIGADGRIFVVGGFNAASAPAMNPAETTVEAYGPDVQLTMSGPNLIVSGDNFAASAPVTVSENGAAVGSGTSSPTGALSPGVTVPSPTTGSHTYVIVDAHSLYPITKSLTVP